MHILRSFVIFFLQQLLHFSLKGFDGDFQIIINTSYLSLYIRTQQLILNLELSVVYFLKSPKMVVFSIGSSVNDRHI